MAAGHDPYFANLTYRATPLTNNLQALGQLLNGMKVMDYMVYDKNISMEEYNRSARDLLPLPQQQKNYVQVDPKHNDCDSSNSHSDTNPRIPVILRHCY